MQLPLSCLITDSDAGAKTHAEAVIEAVSDQAQ